MKISKKERNLLLMVGLILIAFLFFNFIFKPQQAKLTAVKEEHYNKNLELTMKQQKIDNYGNTELTLKKEKEEILPLAETYFGKVDQEEFIVLLNRLSEESGVNFNELVFEEGMDDKKSDNQVLTAEGEDKQGSAPGSGNPKGATDNPKGAKTESESAEPSGENAKPVKPKIEDSEFYRTQFGNIELLTASAEFDGTYEQMTQLIHLMDMNPENIISSSFEWEKPDLEVSSIASQWESAKNKVDSNIEGKILLQFYRVPNIDKYKVEEVSILEEPSVPKSTKANPVMSYPWAWKLISTTKVTDIPGMPGGTNSGIPSIMATKDGLPGILPLNVNVPSRFPTPTPKVREAEPINNVPSISFNTEKPKNDVAPVVETPPVGNFDIYELFRFENLKNINVTSKNVVNKASAVLTTAQGVDHQVISFAYSVDSSSTDGINLNFIDEIIEARAKPQFFELKVFATENTDHSLILNIQDSKGEQYQAKLCEGIDWKGWKAVRTTELPDMQYPIQIKGLTIENKKNSPKISSVILLDVINAGYPIN